MIGLLFLVIFLVVIFLIFQSPSWLLPRKRKRRWIEDDDSNYSISNPGIIPPPEEPLSIFPREESYSPAPEPDFKILGIDSDTHPGSIDFGGGGLLDGSASDTSTGFDSGSSFDSSGFGGGGDFGGGGAGGDWGSSNSDGSS
jgi:hypothetical protein